MKKNHIKEKSQAAREIGKAKPALSGRSEGEGACPTHYYWSFHGQETNSFGKGRHERGNGTIAQRARCDKRGYGWITNRGHSAHTDAPESSQDAPGTVGADRSSKGRWGSMEGSKSGAGKDGRVNVFNSATNVFNSATNSGSDAKDGSKFQAQRLKHLGSLMRFFSFMSRPRLWLCRLSAGNVAVQGFQGEVVAGHNVINFTTLYLAYGGLRYAGFGRNLSLSHPGGPNCCQKITCLHQLYSFATILK